ncbi:MAG: hypothetical protein V7K89_12310 [Nostoc sp.]
MGGAVVWAKESVDAKRLVARHRIFLPPLHVVRSLSQKAYDI